MIALKTLHKILQHTNFNNFLPLPTSFTLTFVNYLPQQSTLEQLWKFLHPRKKFLHSLKLWFSLFYIYFYVYVWKLFSVLWKRFHVMEHFSYSFVTEHDINLSMVLNPCFNSSICCQLHVLFIRAQHHLNTIILVKTILTTLYYFSSIKKAFLFCCLLACINPTIL